VSKPVISSLASEATLLATGPRRTSWKSRGKRTLRAIGLDFYRHKGLSGVTKVLFKPALPKGIPVSPHEGTLRPFLVPVDRITTYAGFSLATGGWHPLVATLAQYQENPSILATDTKLCELARRYQPKSIMDVILYDADEEIEPISSWPVVRPLYRYFWTVSHRRLKRALEQFRRRGPQPHTWFGPTTGEMSHFRFRRLIDLYESIRRYGYRPDLYGHISGYFLCGDTGCTFVIGTGNHRAAILKALGVDEIPVLLQEGHPATVARESLREWTVASGGLLSLRCSVVVFDRMRHETWLEKAKALGISGVTSSN
jgi:hypothetical protein